MPIKTIEFEGEAYPEYQAQGFAAQFAFPFAAQVCTGTGYDVGCNRPEWALPGAIPVDLTFNDGYDAKSLPEEPVDYIFSSHCLEHLTDWVDVLDYWATRIKPGGVLFLYLPHYDQRYWRPWNNRKHVNILTPQILRDYLTSRGWVNIFTSERDLYHGFMVMAERPKLDWTKMGLLEEEIAQLEFGEATKELWDKAVLIYQNNPPKCLQLNAVKLIAEWPSNRPNILHWHKERLKT